MSDDDQRPAPAEEGGEELPEALVETRSGISLVWLVPLVAALVGGWLAWKSFSEQGPTITIEFATAEGLEAGKTLVKYKDVQLGEVEAVELSRDLSRVIVTAQLVDGAERYLTEQTRFWVVRARVSTSQITGLGTLFSGAYIAIDPSTEGKGRRHFVGLERPPVVTSDEPGSVFSLRARDLGSLDIGAPVYYRWIKVGEVLGYELDESGRSVTVRVFVRSPYDQRVRQNTRFWNASGIDVNLDASGLRVDTLSLVSVLIGGIAFDTSQSAEPGGPVEEGRVFTLYPNRRSTSAPTYALKRRYLLHFDQSVGGLVPGSPVEFRGIPIGRVQDVRLVFDPDSLDLRVPVVIEIEPERIEVKGEGEELDVDQRIEQLVERGMRAQLKTGNLLTGQLAVAFDFHPEAPPAVVDRSGRVPELPTIPSPLEEITSSVAHIVDRLETLPIEEIGRDLRSALASLDGTLRELHALSHQVNTELSPSLVRTLENAEETFAAASALIGPDSQASRELKRLLLELADAARSVRLLADRLEQHPEELLQGKQP